MFASVFNSQEAIVFLQSLAQKFLGSFLRTGNDTHISFTPLPRKSYPLHVLVEYENVWLTGCWFENMSQRLVSAFNPSLQNGAEKNCVWMSGSHTGASSRMWAKHQASHRLEDAVFVSGVQYLKYLRARIDLGRYSRDSDSLRDPNALGCVC